MDIHHRLFPYPVLSHFSDDYVNGKFVSEVSVDKEKNAICFHISVSLDNNKLKELINNDKAEFVFHIECSQTSYRTIFKTKEYKNTISISESKLCGKVSICSFILAKEDIIGYTNVDFNQDYHGIVFNIEKGNILAIGGQYDVNIIKEIDELSKIPSIFSILRRDTDDESSMEIDIEHDKIGLWLSNEDFFNYQAVIKRTNFQPSIHAMLIFPALIFIFERLKSLNDVEYEEYKTRYRWFTVIENLLKKDSTDSIKDIIEIKTSFYLAQKLLNLPINRAIKALVSIGEEDDGI